jgi:hypothetical protein
LGQEGIRTAGGTLDGHSMPNLHEHWLGRSLRRMYDDALQEPIPDGLRDLLEELERRDRPKP